MSGVEERLKYLENTKGLIKTSINRTGGNITEDTPFSEYPNQIKNIIKNSEVTPNKVVNDLAKLVIEINGNSTKEGGN